jgi:hypothetical protein
MLTRLGSHTSILDRILVLWLVAIKFNFSVYKEVQAHSKEPTLLAY